MSKWRNEEIAESRNDRTTIWRNGKTTKWNNGEIIKWQNPNMKKCQKWRKIKNNRNIQRLGWKPEPNNISLNAVNVERKGVHDKRKLSPNAENWPACASLMAATNFPDSWNQHHSPGTHTQKIENRKKKTIKRKKEKNRKTVLETWINNENN